MKVANSTLSTQQRRAQEKYKLAIVPAMFVAVLGCEVLGIVVLEILRYFHLNNASSSSSTVMMPFMFAGFGIARARAIREVRGAGLSLESREVEVIDITDNNFEGDAKNWYAPKTFIASVGNVSIPFVFVCASWFLWHVSAFSSLNKVLGIVTFWPFLWCGIVGLIFLRAPHVQIDEDGIAAFPHPFWRQRAHWKDIARCEIRTNFDYMGRGAIRSFIFRDSTGKARLRLIPGSLIGLSHEEQAEIEAEIRRRFATVVTTPAENLTA